jgi:TPR repeat protein
MNIEKLESAKKVFFIALGIDMAVTAVVVASDVWMIGVVKDIQSGALTAAPALLNTIDWWASFSKVIVLTMLGVGWALTRWLGACYLYAKETLKATGLIQEGWKTWGWIVPFMNLFKPYQVLGELYKVGAANTVGTEEWKKTAGSGLLLVWWIFWVIAHLFMVGIAKFISKDSLGESLPLHQIVSAYGAHIVLCVISLMIAGFWLVVAESLTRRLQGSPTPVAFTNWALIVFGAIPVVGIAAAVGIPAYQDYTKGQGSTAKLADATQTSSGTDWANGTITPPSQPSAAPQNSQIDAFLNQQPKVNPFDQFDEKPSKSSAVKEAGPWSKFTPEQRDNTQRQVIPNMTTAKRDKYEEFLDSPSSAVKVPNSLTSEEATGRIIQPIPRASTDAVLQNNRGMKYLKGEGVTKDYVEAVSWFRLAAAQGDAYAQYNLGVSYEKGQGVPKDYVEAVRWYRMAAAQEHAYAQSNLGSKYFTGEGVAQDYVESARWYRLAAAQGNADAQFWLGTMYFKGEGVIQDNLRAHMWTNLSAVDGVAYMVKARNAVAKKMTPLQIAEAQQMARDCQQRKFKGCD